MTRGAEISRRECLKAFAAAAGVGLGNACGAFAATERVSRAPVYLESWDIIESGNNCMRKSKGKVLRIVGSNGARAGLPAHICSDLGDAVELLKGRDLLDHDGLFDFLAGERVPHKLRRAIDMLGWDIHARMRGKSLAKLLGAERTRVRRYGDVRWRDGDTPQSYGRKVGDHLRRNHLTAAKLHLPGLDHPERRLPVATLLVALRAARRAAGPEPVLAYDPQPGWAAGTEEDALTILRVMEDEGYEWLEEPYNWNAEGAIAKYAALCPKTTVIIQQEERGDCGYERFVRWARAGAVGQWSYDVLIHGSITQAVRILRWAAANREERLVRVNLHWAWTPHVHLVASVDMEIAPYFEDPYAEEIPPVEDDPAYAAVPTWPGIYRIDRLEA